MGDPGKLLTLLAASFPWLPLGLALVRLLPLVLLTPVFGGQLLPARMRVAVALVLALPLALHREVAAPANAVALTTMALREAGIGLSLALAVRLLFELLAVTGAVVDAARGANAGAQNDPSMATQSTPLAVAMRQLLLIAFFTLRGPALLLEQVGDSFATLPLGAAPAATMFAPAAWLDLVARLMGAAIGLAAPAVLLLFLVDVALALVARAAPQIQVWSLGLVVKGPLGVLAVAGSLAVVLRAQLQAATAVVLQWLAVLAT